MSLIAGSQYLITIADNQWKYSGGHDIISYSYLCDKVNKRFVKNEAMEVFAFRIKLFDEVLMQIFY